MNEIIKEHIEFLKQTAIKAGEIIMDYYENGAKKSIKEDNSPVTEADLAANDFICAQLKKNIPEILIVSEENKPEENEQARQNKLFWMIDPLDGTKSFIKKTGEFTVNIALIADGKTIAGIVYVPAKKQLYYTGSDGAAYKQNGENAPKKIAVRNLPAAGMEVVASKSHLTKETEDYISKLPKVSSFISASSSVKFCLVAEGKADIYPRFGPTMEWDTAAAHAVLLAAGGKVVDENGSELVYGKQGFLNPYFVASS